MKHLITAVLVLVGCKKANDADLPSHAPAPAPSVKEPAPIPAPAVAPAVAPAAPATSSKKRIEATKDGVAGLSHAKPVTLADLKQLAGAEISGPFEEKRGGVKTWHVQVTAGDSTLTVVFKNKAKQFSWFQTSGFSPELTTCIEDVCLGDGLDKARALAGTSCKANHDGQGFSASFRCEKEGSSLVILAALPDDVRQDHALGQKTDAFPIDELIAAKGIVENFAWVETGSRWAPAGYDEGDR